MNLATRILILKVVFDFIGDAYAAAKDEANELLERGTRLPATAPNGADLGSVTKTKPKKDAKVTAPGPFSLWVKQNYPQHMSWSPGNDTAAITRVLQRHAPELLVGVPSTEFVQAMRKRALDQNAVTGPGGEAEVPGFAIVEGRSSIQPRSADNAFPEVLALFRGGLTLESLLPKQIEGEQ